MIHCSRLRSWLLSNDWLSRLPLLHFALCSHLFPQLWLLIRMHQSPECFIDRQCRSPLLWLVVLCHLRQLFLGSFWISDVSFGAEIRCQAGLCHRTGLNIRPVAMNVVDVMGFFLFILLKKSILPHARHDPVKRNATHPGCCHVSHQINTCWTAFS